ncbi:MAG: hypothetical protein JXD21_00815 [Candidatus Omnitrophica bacterium]|nr:hypothetical protein [Candidatus Omnitrophota bacterium]
MNQPRRNSPQADDRRKYIRISTVFPVEFTILDETGKKITPWLQGFTSNIGKGGICLEVNDLWWGFWDRLSLGANLLLNIHLPLGKKTVTAGARIVWRRRQREEHFSRCLCGLEFFEIEKQCARSLFRYAVWRKTVPMVAVLVIAALFAISGFLWFEQARLVRENKTLVARYFQTIQETNMLNSGLESEQKLLAYFRGQQKTLEKQLQELNEELLIWQEKYAQVSSGADEVSAAADVSAAELHNNISRLQNDIRELSRKNQILQAQLAEKKELTDILAQGSRVKEKEKREYAARITAGMYQWISSRQDLHTGLVLSYEGDDDLKRVAFSYDQALAAIVFCLYQRPDRAKKILDFYLNAVEHDQDIYNAYYTSGGVFEYVVHAGPNAWIGLAALHYVDMTKDRTYLKIAEKVSDFLLEMMDDEGGIKGGPKVQWYSTEHNLDSSAFFKLFSRVSAHPICSTYAKKIDEWLDRYAYTQKAVPINRGRGDATIATDTYTWSITALGPQVLLQYDMDPDQIVEFAIKNCEVNVDLRRHDLLVQVTGFDFAKAQHIPRGGVISCEWTSQMVLALEILADYYRTRDAEKSRYYFEKALFYFEELQKMVINSPSPVGKAYPTLPYASQSFIDTGHGWRTPKGDQVGSLAATAYFLISYQGFNPLTGEALAVPIRSVYEERDNRSYTETH